MPPQLLALTDGPSILLDKPILLLGRHQECDIQLVSRKVSRRHCCIAQVGDHLVVRDLGSTNGIRINGVRVLEGNLKPGDELTIGNYRYEVRWDALGVPSPSRSGRKTDLRREPGPPAPAFDDDALESCEEPVPLAEGPGRPKAPIKPPQPLPSAGHDPVAEDAANKGLGFHDHERSLILPDNLELAPGSDARPSVHEPPPGR
jgi:predicted component of type VI protein secretion system